MKILLLAGAAGFIGTILRFWMMRGLGHVLPGFPWGTLIVNVLGAFAAGLLFVLCRSKFLAFEDYFPVIFIGFLGAFTTFSAFALESVRLFADAQYLKFFWNLSLQNVAGISAAGLGFVLGRLLV